MISNLGIFGSLVIFSLIASAPLSFASEVPEWVKNTAGWWADDVISEIEFINAIEFLLNDGIIHVIVSESTEPSQGIPDWVKNTAGWWADDVISEIEFINAIEFLIQSNIILVNIHDTSNISSLLLTWDEVVRDAKHANDGSLITKEYHFPNSDIMLSTPFDVDDGTFIDETTFDLLNSGIGLYRITGDVRYLDQSRSVANTIEKNLLTEDGRLLVYTPITHKYLLGHNQLTLHDVASLALIDPAYENLTRILANYIITHEINPDTNLFYNSDFMDDQQPEHFEMYMSYRGSSGLESLLLTYEVTGDKKYLEQVKKTLLSYWGLRNSETNLIPASINAKDSSTEKNFMQQYGAGIFLKILLHYYYLTDDPEILQIMNVYADAVIINFWDGATWDYRVNSDGSILSNVIEGNYAKLDDALILLNDLNYQNSNTNYEYAKMDYDNSFQNKISVINNLVIHSVKDDGSKDSPQSMMQYAFIINQNVGSRLFHDTNNPEYLISLNEFYHSAIQSHKQELGYIFGIDAYTLENTSLGVFLNQRASAMIANKINLTFMPHDNVEIIWTKIGNHEISEPFITTFEDSGRFNSIDFNYNDKSIFFHTIHNAGQITFAHEIESVIVNNEIYVDFDSHTLNTLDGTHAYLVFLK